MKLFMAMLPYRNKLEYLPHPFTSTQVSCLQAKLELTIVDHHMELYSNGRLLALPTIIRLIWKGREVANTLAYYNTAKITVVKRFIVQVHGD
jgi:hypothetical protein